MTEFRGTHHHSSPVRSGKREQAGPVRAGLSVDRRCQCDASSLGCTIQAEPCCRAVHTRCISREPLPPPCYFILGHQKIEAIFQPFKNISSFTERIPARCHTHFAHLCCPLPSPTQHCRRPSNPLPSGTTVRLRGREDGASKDGEDGVASCSPLLRSCFLDSIGPVSVVCTFSATVEF